MKKYLFLALAVLWLTLWGGAYAQDGKAIYESKCAVCHGTTGKGDGPAAVYLFPKPRDFTLGTFKVRSTPSGSLPTDDDLSKVLQDGMKGTAMPSWRNLTKAEHQAVIDYVKTLSPRWKEEKPEAAVAVPTRALNKVAALAARGKEVYKTMKCWECHGETGKGDGPSAATLKDDWGYTIVPYDFTRRGRFKGGSRPQDVYRTFMTGMDGTPMPSFQDSVPEKDRWPLVYYVLSLSRPEPRELTGPEERQLVSRYVKGKIPTDPFAPQWQRAPVTVVPLRLLWLRPKAADKVKVRSLNNGKEIAFLLQWEDDITDRQFIRSEEFRDAAAIQFALGNGEPHFAMGDAQHLVNIWHWKADWQADLARFQDVAGVYPGMAVDEYPFLRGVPAGSRSPMAEKASTEQHSPTFLTGWSADNPFSEPKRTTAVENLLASGFGTLTSQPREAQNIKGWGRWQEGKWHVIMTRSLLTDNPRDIQFFPGKTVPVAFAVWNGSLGDRDGQKAISIWQSLKIQPSR